MISATQRPALARLIPAPAALAVSGGLAGAALTAIAWATSPFIVVGLLAGALVVALTLQRPEIGVAVAFVLVPLSNLGLTGDPPWLLTSVWALALLLLGLWRHPHDRPPPLILAVVASVLAALVTFVTGGGTPDGYPEVRASVVGFLYFAAVALLIRTRRQVEWALGGVVCVVLLVGLVALEERFGGTPITTGFFTSDGELVGRVAAGFGHPNQLGGFLVLLLPFAVASVLLTPRLRFLAVPAVALGAYAVYASFSRSALIALVAVPLAFLRPRLALLVTLLGMLAVLAAPGLVRERFATLTESGSEVATRVDFWRTAAHIWEERPLLGAGLGRFPDAYSAARDPGRAFLPNTLGEPPPHAHNLFLHALSTQGLLGLLGTAGRARLRAGRGAAAAPETGSRARDPRQRVPGRYRGPADPQPVRRHPARGHRHVLLGAARPARCLHRAPHRELTCGARCCSTPTGRSTTTTRRRPTRRAPSRRRATTPSTSPERAFATRDRRRCERLPTGCAAS